VDNFRERLLPFLGPLLAVIGSVGWVNAQIASLDRGDKDRDKIREVAVGARDKEISNLHEDLRELRAEIRHCKD
jgi:hypothetical protein